MCIRCVKKITNEMIHKALIKSKENEKASEELFDIFLEMSRRFVRKPNFANFPEQEDMIIAGLYRCLDVWKSFDIKKSKHSFSFFTQAIHQGVLQTIIASKKKNKVKGVV